MENGINVHSPKQIRALLEKKGFAAQKRFGQNFLCDRNIAEKIAGAIPEGQNVIEIGTGLGALTELLCERAKKVVTLEIDDGLYAYRTHDYPLPDNAAPLHRDALDTDLDSLREEYFGGAAYYLCGNFPYYITGKLLFAALNASSVLGLCAMVQKEVALRLCALPGSSDYGAVTADFDYFSHPKALFTVPASCFYPAPKVDSAVIYADLSHPACSADKAAYQNTVKAAFSMRRKTIGNNLKAAFGERGIRALEECGINPSARAQELSAAHFARLARALFGGGS